MSGIWYTDLIDVLHAAGVLCKVDSVNVGWETRSRSSGGFPSTPLAVFWHHTASQTSPQNDLNYMINGSPDAPVGNMLLDREGFVWPIAAGASNCAGKGGPAAFSRGTIPLDSGNTRGWQIEAANSGVGEPWTVQQINAYFLASNALNAHFGNKPSDVITHHAWAPDRKIDPARAEAVQGPWRPRSANGSGTWNLDDIRAECAMRSGIVPPPVDPPSGGWVCPPFPGTGDYGCSYQTCRAWQDAMIAKRVITDNEANHDGVWGNGMHNACFNMQRSWGWSDADGIGGQHTWPHLQSRGVAPCPKCGG